MRQILFIINPTAGAGRARDRWLRLDAQLRKAGLSGDQVVTSQPREALRLAQEAAPKYDLLVAAGGDGTVSEVASGIVSSGARQTVLGLVPLGTGNDFARTVGLSTEHDAQFALLGNRAKLMDVIEVRCILDGTSAVRYSLSFAAVGITGELLKGTTQSVKRVFGSRLAYLAGLLRALWRYRANTMRVTCDHQTFEERFLLVCASNSEFAGGGLRLAPGANIEDGFLNVNLIKNVGRWETLGQLRRLRHGRHTSHPKVSYQTARRLLIETDPPIEVAVDGDLVGRTPATFQIKPQTLPVLSL